MLKNVNQPKVIHINETLRLRKFDEVFDFALKWYRDEYTIKMVSGENALPFDMATVERMYNYN